MTTISHLYAFEDKADGDPSRLGGETPSANADCALREKARNLMLAGILPDRPPDRIWGRGGQRPSMRGLWRFGDTRPDRAGN